MKLKYDMVGLAKHKPSLNLLVLHSASSMTITFECLVWYPGSGYPTLSKRCLYIQPCLPS